MYFSLVLQLWGLDFRKLLSQGYYFLHYEARFPHRSAELHFAKSRVYTGLWAGTKFVFIDKLPVCASGSLARVAADINYNTAFGWSRILRGRSIDNGRLYCTSSY